MVAISVIVPVYNVEHYLTRCINSLINQNFQEEYEIICVNDGSTDSSGLMLEQFAKQTNKIRIISQENKGLSEARNVGMNYVSGKYTLFVDPDDFLALNALQILYDFAEAHNSDVLIFDIHKVTQDLKMHQTTRWQNIIDKYGETSFNLHNAESFVYRFVPVAVWNKLYLTSLIKGINFIKGIAYEDVPYWASVYTKASRINYLPIPLYFYVTNRQQSISQNVNYKIFDVFTAFDKAKHILQQAGCYENLKYIHWAHFASNLVGYIKKIDERLLGDLICRIKDLVVDIDYDEFNKQGFFPFEVNDMRIIRMVRENDFETVLNILRKF